MIEQHGWLEISREALRHNIALLRERAGGVKVCAAIKANAYGHGRYVFTYLDEMGVDWACVYSIDEWYPFNFKINVKVLCLAPLVQRVGMDEILARTFDPITDQPTRVVINDLMTALAFSKVVARKNFGFRWPVHVQIDTGLTRGGILPSEAHDLLQFLSKDSSLKLEGIFAHLSHGDVPGDLTLEDQSARLKKVASPYKAADPELIVHLQNSGGVVNWKSDGFDMIRIGIGMYGLQPSIEHPIEGLRPIARMVARILAIHERPAGTGVGYGHTFVTQRTSRLAIVPVGYGDGYPRAMSNRGVVQIRGKNAPVVGRVSMDQIIIDVTDVAGASLGDEVVVMSNDPSAPNCVDRIAQACGTIGYEIATGFGDRLERRIV